MSSFSLFLLCHDCSKSISFPVLSEYVCHYLQHLAEFFTCHSIHPHLISQPCHPSISLSIAPLKSPSLSPSVLLSLGNDFISLCLSLCLCWSVGVWQNKLWDLNLWGSISSFSSPLFGATPAAFTGQLHTSAAALCSKITHPPTLHTYTQRDTANVHLKFSLCSKLDKNCCKIVIILKYENELVKTTIIRQTMQM